MEGEFPSRWRLSPERSEPEAAFAEALERLLATHPLHEISVEMILGEAGLSRSTFYSYFSDKNELMTMLAAQVYDEMFKSISPWWTAGGAGTRELPRSSLKNAVEAWGRYGPVLAATMETEHAAPKLHAVWLEALDRATLAIAEEIRRERRAGGGPRPGPLRRRSPGRSPGRPSASSTSASAGSTRPCPTSTPSRRCCSPWARPASTEPPGRGARMSTGISRNGNPRTRTAILTALSDLLDSKALEAINVADILNEAGLSSRTTFYKHFASRDEAFMALVQDKLAETRAIVEAVIGDPGVRRSPEMRQAVTLWIRRAGRHRGLVLSVLAEWPRVAALNELFLGFMRALSAATATAIEEDRKAGLVVSDLPSERLAAMALWSAERSVYAALVRAEGFTDGHAVADVLVGTHLSVTYGVDLTPAARDAGRAAWLLT